MNNQTTPKPDQVEQEKQHLVRQGNQLISDDLKKAVDIAFKLSHKEPPHVKVETLTNCTHRES
ncbi:hypothetical protein [Candidatus Spongiihabitans sp.]|uniref:hypothetical protein n=1 Tax=Candidatus Spongiihabitans sp. TaxID=3101308 RepID=UPI003C7EA7B8